MKAIILLLFITTTALAQDYVEVRGHAFVKVAPDRIYLRIHVSDKHWNQADLENKVTEMTVRLNKLGIDPRNIVIKELASNFRRRDVNKIIDDNLVLSREFIVCVDNATKANMVMVELKKMKISNVSVDHLDHSKINELGQQSMTMAIADAKEKASAITNAIERTIKKTLSVQELPNEIPVEPSSPYLPTHHYTSSMYSYASHAYKTEVSSSPHLLVTHLDFDEITLECTVIARFELK